MMLYSNRNNQKIRISVALCTYNGGRYLKDQLQSIARQTRLPDELVICDDQSTDDTSRVVGDFAQQASFPVSFNINPQRLGVTRNFERAFGLCQGQFIAPCDQDDIWLPEKLATLARVLEHDSQCLLSFCDMAILTNQGHATNVSQWNQLGFNANRVAAFNDGKSLETLLRYNVVTGMAMMFRRSLLTLATPLPAQFIHDEWLSLLAACTGKVTAVNQQMVQYRQHASQSIGAANRNVIAQWRYARQHMGQEYIDRQIVRTELLRDKLASLPAESLRPDALDLVSAKLEHLRRRQAMRQHWYTRLSGAVSQGAQGQYQKFGYGWKSMAQDLFL